MSVEEALDRPAYTWRGRVGVLVPPGNTTVEPELATGLPAGLGVYASRLPGRTQEDTSIGLRERFVEYNATLRRSADSFGGLPLDAMLFACTGASYLGGPDSDAALVTDLTAGARQACTAALAVRQLLEACGSRRVALVSPYPDWLTALAVEYWTACGLEVAGVAPVPDVTSIYAITPAAVIGVARSLGTAGADAIVLSGTGMPTLPCIPRIADELGIPVISSASASIWWLANALDIPPDDLPLPAVRRIPAWTVG